MSRSRLSASLAAAAATALVAVQLASAGPSAAAPKVPFADRDATGYVGFCDASGKQVTSGRTDVHPFVVKAVASAAAPQDYRAEIGGKATIYVFQPRRGTEPSEWAGRQVTAASAYTNSRAPMAAGTELDYSLADLLSVYPARWDGLLQVRMFLSAPNRPVMVRPYSAVVVKVSGNRWQTVGGGKVDCGAGTAKSSELTNLSPEQFRAALVTARKQRALQRAAAASADASGSATSAGGTDSAGGSSGSSGASGTQGDSAATAGEQRAQQSGDGGSAVVWVVVVLAAGLLLSGVVLAARRRRLRADG